MKVIISQIIEFEGDNFPYTWRKTIETNVIPRTGDFIEESLWKDPGMYEVIETVINYQENYCLATVKQYDHTVPITRKDEYKHIAELHGWEALWNF